MQPTSRVQGVTPTSWRKWSGQGRNHTAALDGSSFLLDHPTSMGGLWEAAVKSMKHHLRRVMANSILNYEEMTIIICQIEQVLNNRPLMAVTNNPDDILPITPSMLVNGSRLDTIPQPSLQTMDARGHPVKRFRSIQQLLSQFWERWSSEYVASLQPRGKWR